MWSWASVSSRGIFVVFIVRVWGINQAVLIREMSCRHHSFSAGGLMNVWEEDGSSSSSTQTGPRVPLRSLGSRPQRRLHTAATGRHCVDKLWEAESSRSAAVGERGLASWPSSRPLLFIRVKCVIIWSLRFSSFTFTTGGTIKGARGGRGARPITARLFPRATALDESPYPPYF